MKLSKFEEIKKAILSKSYPIIVYGPSGTGKTSTILGVLKSLGLKYSYVDISTVIIERPVFKNLIRLCDLNSLKEMGNIKSKENLIIETHLHYGNNLGLCGIKDGMEREIESDKGVDGKGVDGKGVDGKGVDGKGVDGKGVDGEGVDGKGDRVGGMERVNKEGINDRRVNKEGMNNNQGSNQGMNNNQGTLIKFKPMTGKELRTVFKKELCDRSAKVLPNFSTFNGNLFSLQHGCFHSQSNQNHSQSNHPKQSQSQSNHSQPQPNHQIDFYRMIGRIFYSKIGINDIRIDGDKVYMSVTSRDGNKNRGDGTRMENRREERGGTSRGGNKNRRKLMMMKELRKEREGNKPACRIRGRGIIESSDGESDWKERGSDESDWKERESKTVGRESSPGDNDDPVENDTAFNALSVEIALSKNKVMGYLQENMTKFGALGEVAKFYEILSEGEGEGSDFIKEAFVGCLLKNAIKPGGRIVFRPLREKLWGSANLEGECEL